MVFLCLAALYDSVLLAISTGAGAGSQHSIGTGVIGGMITATVLAIFWVPLFFVSISSLFKSKVKPTETPHDEAGQ